MVTTTETVEVWDRQPGEPTRKHGAFRHYRDLPSATRTLEATAGQINLAVRTVREWAAEWDWRERAQAWDDACHKIDDAERLEAIRSMHSKHRTAGRAMLDKAIEALDVLPAEALTVGAVARYMELGAKLERQTLIVSVEELQGIEAEDDGEDAWDRIARELDPTHDPAG